MINIVFYGTGDFAAECLKSILSDERFRVLAVITQPDRPIGRKQELVASSVKNISQKNNLLIYQPETLKDFATAELSKADLGVVAQYGLIIPKRLLEMPRRKTVNLHASLLPKYRGASPIQTAMMEGEKVSGVTLMLMDEKMDHGPILATIETQIGADETQPDLSDRLAKLSGQLFLEKAPLWVDERIEPTEQNHELATYCKILTRQDGKIIFDRSAEEIYNQWRGLTPWPGIWATFQGKRLKINKLSMSGKSGLSPGQMICEDGRIHIGCGAHSSIEARELQLEGKNSLSAREFVNGLRDTANLHLS